jgi:hypothetical protein
MVSGIHHPRLCIAGCTIQKCFFYSGGIEENPIAYADAWNALRFGFGFQPSNWQSESRRCGWCRHE